MLFANAPDGVLKMVEEHSGLFINPSDARTSHYLGYGTCYVMNETGKTVGTYRLDDVDVNGPLDQPGLMSSQRNPPLR